MYVYMAKDYARNLEHLSNSHTPEVKRLALERWRMFNSNFARQCDLNTLASPRLHVCGLQRKPRHQL